MKNILGKNDGFTLIELLVVILIIGILIAVAAPSFLGQTKKAQDIAAKQDLALTYKAAKADATDREGAWGNEVSLAAAITASEPGLDPSGVGVVADDTAACGLSEGSIAIGVVGTTLNSYTTSASGTKFKQSAAENGVLSAPVVNSC